MKEKETQRVRGMGRVFKRGEVYWIAYYAPKNGWRVEVRESSRSRNPKEAEKLLKHRLKEAGAADLGLKPFIGPQQDRWTMDELFGALESDLELRGKLTPQERSRLKPLRDFFSGRRAVAVTEEPVDRYVQGRLREGKSPGTVNRELQKLSQAFRKAVMEKKLSGMPIFRKLPEHNARTGFFEHAEFEAVLEHLPHYLRGFAKFGYLTGWRKGEIASRTWGDVDLQGRVIRLRAENSKNRQPRTVALEGQLWDIIEEAWQARQIQTQDGQTRLSTRVFHRAGRPVGDFKKAWKTATEKAGFPGKLFHDLRRTAVRNMVRAGVREKVAMSISGHRTRSIFDRYNIVDEEDLRQAARLTQEYLERTSPQLKVVPFEKAREGSGSK